jgi:hypothetical protein
VCRLAGSEKGDEMSKTIQELALAAFLLISGVSVLLGLLWLRPVLDSQRLLIEETRKGQQEVLTVATEAREIITDVGFAVAVLAMTDKRMIPPGEGEKMIGESIAAIEARSPRLGKLAKHMNDFRLQEQRRR